MPYDPDSETLEQMRKRIERDEAKRAKCPTPEEIAERAAEIRAGWVDENGVLKAPPRNDNEGDGRLPRKYTPGIRQIPASIHRK